MPWANRYTAMRFSSSSKHIFRLQEDIVAKYLHALRIEMAMTMQITSHKGSNSLETHSHHLEIYLILLSISYCFKLWKDLLSLVSIRNKI